MTRKQERKIEKAWNDRPEPKASIAHQSWMREYVNENGTLTFQGHTYEWDYRNNVWVRF